MRLANVTRICHHFIDFGLIDFCEAAGRKVSLPEAAVRTVLQPEAAVQTVSLPEAAVQALGGLEGIGGPGHRPADNQQVCTGGQRLDR